MRKLTVIGDYNPEWETHLATNAAIEHSRLALDASLEATWCSTAEIGPRILAESDGFWIASGAPYKDVESVFAAIRHARENGVPCLGTCQGFQHVMLEYARAFLDMAHPTHQEYDPKAAKPFISELGCSLRGQEMQLSLSEGSLAGRSYGAKSTTERYYCRFGINPDFVPAVRNGPIRVSGFDREGEIRIVEYPDHPFMLATLFVPQARSSAGSPHPLITAFLREIL